MFLFPREQKISEIGGVKLGGQPGQLPTVLIGSIFYHGHKIVEDEEEGIFDTDKAKTLLDRELEQSARTGNPRIVDVVAAWPQAMTRYIDFIAEATESPFSIDGATAEVRIAGLKHVCDLGLVNRAVYNSISPGFTTDEISAIRNAGLKSAILLAYNAHNPTLQGRMEVIKELIGVAAEAGIENCLIDTTVLDLPDPGPAARAIHLVKETYGLPAGCGAHNAVDRWNSGGRLDPTTYLTAITVANVVPITMGASFLLYGPIDQSPSIYTACGVADAYVAYSARQEYGTKPLTDCHPLRRIFTRPKQASAEKMEPLVAGAS
jgi:tetrahydromethanopterin S-methyltransferase subunit H